MTIIDLQRTGRVDRVNDQALDILFREARTHSAWLPKPIPEELLRELYELTNWGPTSANGSPSRFVFLRSAAARERLRPALAGGNIEKTMSAPVTVNNPQLIEETAKRNSSLQGAYFMLAARAVGLDCGPMSGFDNAKVDRRILCGRQMNIVAPRATAVILENTGHWVMEENLKETTDALLKFLEGSQER